MKKFIAILFAAIIYLNLAAQDKFTDPRDGNSYRTINVSGIAWMAENLRYIVPGSQDNYFDNDPNNAASFGVLYDWKTATKACPAGWHLPSGDEFHTLANHFEVDDEWVKKGSGPISFDIKLGGMQDYEGTFTEMDESAYFWTSTEYNENEAEYFSCLILNNHTVVDISRECDSPDIHGAEKVNKYSVRCVKD
jgi:uncharacterized protein (TIGR02145 family)